MCYVSPQIKTVLTTGEELAKTIIESLAAQIDVMSLGHLHGWPYHLQTHQLVPALLESGDDVTNQTALHSVGFDGQEGPLLVGSWDAVDGQSLGGGLGEGGVQGGGVGFAGCHVGGGVGVQGGGVG